MGAVENRVWQRWQDARMNKYYHQTLASWFKMVSSAANLLALAALAAAGARISLEIPTPFLEVLVWAAAFFSLAVVVLNIPTKIGHHESLYREFNTLEYRYSGLNRRFETPGAAKVETAEIEGCEKAFMELEARQDSPTGWLLRYCDNRVRVEFGQKKQYWPLPIFRDIKRAA